MSEYGFFVAHLRFIAAKTDASDANVSAMVAELTGIADAIESGNDIAIAADNLRIAARGLAGVAGFLQEQILPEVVAADNAAGERQVRWVIDTSMRLMTRLTTRAEMDDSGEPFILALPPPPSPAAD